MQLSRGQPWQRSHNKAPFPGYDHEFAIAHSLTLKTSKRMMSFQIGKAFHMYAVLPTLD